MNDAYSYPPKGIVVFNHLGYFNLCISPFSFTITNDNIFIDIICI